MSFDSRPALPHVEVPVVLVCGDRDRFFPAELVEETARLIPDCTLVLYAGQGHMKVATSRRVPRGVVALLNRH
jgi:pimeloyl-ACP methyl ester carboxylesterase